MGGGDWRTLPLIAKSIASIDASASVGVGGAPSDFAIEGDLLCLWRYEEEFDRGGVGRPISGDRSGPSSQYDDDRLMEGLVGFDEAGDCADGGVYGISPV